jgi:hypothetical protein
VGADGCSYTLPSTKTYDELGFKGAGGATASLVNTCARCGVPYQSMMCHALASLAPTIDDPRYGPCGKLAFDLVGCLEPASCVCGSLPEACEATKQQLEMCTVDSSVDGGVAVEKCWFEPLALWNRCQETWSKMSGSMLSTRSSCGERCLADPTCSSVVDYTWIDPALGCQLFHEPACTQITDPSIPEDAAREYRKRCGTDPPSDAIFAFDDEPGIVVDPSSGCHFESIGDWMSCENAVSFEQATVTGKSLTECLLACERRPDCTAVQDFWPDPGGPTAFECTLHISSCSAPVMSGGEFRFYRKVCS